MAVKALLFDVFGTVVDWRGSIIREGAALNKEKNLTVNWAQFADDWRAGYQPAMNQIRRGESPWVTLDVIHRQLLDDLLVKYGIPGLDEAARDHLNRVWHRLQPWPDAIDGLQRLREKFVIATLSNGNMALLTHMAKQAGLPWDCILSAELARHYKPDKAVYLTAAGLLDLQPPAVMMVAAHEGDIVAAKQLGFATAYVTRPLEFGPGGKLESPDESVADIIASDFRDLADKLGI